MDASGRTTHETKSSGYQEAVVEEQLPFPGSLRNTVHPVHNRTAIHGSLRNTVHPVHKKSRPRRVGFSDSVKQRFSIT